MVLEELRAAIPAEVGDDRAERELIRRLEETSGVIERTLELLQRRESARSLEALLEKIRARVPEEITSEEVADLVTRMQTLGQRVAIAGTPQGCRNPEDDKFLETAKVGGADLLVSEDKELLSMTVPGLAIVNAREFVALLAAQP